MSIAVLVARLCLGLGIAAHGTQKLFGWYGGHGIAGTGGAFESMGFRPGRLFALAAGLGEAGSGALIVLGLFGPVGPALLLLVMLVAMFSVHIGHGFFAAANGVEIPLLYAAGALLLAFTGPGRYSLDELFDLRGFTTVRGTWISVGVAVVLAVINLLARRRGGGHASPSGA